MPDGSDDPAQSQLMRGLDTAFEHWLEVPKKDRPPGWQPFWGACKWRQDLEPLREPLIGWARRFRLTYTPSQQTGGSTPEPADWVMDVVRETFEAWSKSESRFLNLNYALPVHLVRAEPPGTIWGSPKTWGKKVGWQRFQLRQSTPRRSPKWLPNENSIAPEGPSNKAPARGPRGPIKSGLPRPITSVARI